MSRLKSLYGKPFHQAALFGGLAILLYFAFWNYVTSPVKAETASVVEQVEKLKQDNEKARIASQRINEFRAAYAQKQAEYEELKALLPEQRELTVVLQGLQDRARGRMSVRRFSPKDDVQKDFYSSKAIEVEISGSYNNLGSFFADMAQYQRIVSISDFKLNRSGTQTGGSTIDAQFTLNAFYVSAEKLAAPGAVPVVPGAPAVPGAIPAPAAAVPAPTKTSL